MQAYGLFVKHFSIFIYFPSRILKIVSDLRIVSVCASVCVSVPLVLCCYHNVTKRLVDFTSWLVFSVDLIVGNGSGPRAHSCFPRALEVEAGVCWSWGLPWANVSKQRGGLQTVDQFSSAGPATPMCYSKC